VVRSSGHRHPHPAPGQDQPQRQARHWNHRDSDFTKVTDDSKDVILMLERVSADAVPDSQMESAQKLLSSLLATRFGLVVEATLNGASPTAMLPQAGS
jgi:DNA/RNA-binding domain of Phe-tRNA-synthetase-like protein